jgi:uncharacterized DUF497 family protein
MEFEWDEAKRAANIEKHGLDFLRAAQLFDGRPAITASTSRDGEARWKTTGLIEDVFITVIWTAREGRVRIISARRAWNAEERQYCAIHGRGD